jgi:hypothetical protein
MKNINFTFSPNTANTTLRSHIERLHLDEHVRICKARGWSMLLPKQKQQVTEANTGQPRDPGAPRSQFSRQTFLEHIIHFIVADDQVCLNIFETCHSCLPAEQSINVIECPEFWDLLLLLHQDLHDKDIPRCTKLRESIVQVWEQWFKTLSQELSVCSVISEPYVICGY